MGLHFGKAALRVAGMASHQGFAGQKSQDRVSQELKLFVVSRRLGVLFVDARFVRQGALQKIAVAEAMSEVLFQLIEIGGNGRGRSVMR